MTKPVFLVTGATGKTGSAVVQQLLEQGQRTRAVVRRHDARSERLRQAGAEIVVADLFDPEQLLAAPPCRARSALITAPRSILS